LGGNAAAIAELDALRSRPLAHLGWFEITVGPSSGAGPALSHAAPARGPGHIDEWRQRLAETVGILRAQVDLVLAAFERELHRRSSLGSIQVVDQLRDRLFRHRVCS